MSFYQGPTLNVIMTDDDQKGTRIDNAYEKRKLIEPVRGIKKRASALIVVFADAPLEKEASTGLMDLVLELDAIEKRAQGVYQGLKKLVLKPGQVAPPKAPKLQPKPTPEGVQKALRPPKRVKGPGLEVAVGPGGKLAPQKGEPAPKGYEFLKDKPRAKAGYEGEEVTKRLRTPIGEAVSKIPLVGKKLAPGTKVKMTPDEYRVMKAKVISGDIPKQLYAMGARGAKAIGRGVQRAADLPVVGAPFAAKRALAKMPLRERVELAAIERSKGKMTGAQTKRLKELKKKLKVEREVKPEVEGLPKAFRGARGRAHLEQVAIPGKKRWDEFTRQTESDQVKSLAGSLHVRGRKGGQRPARHDEVQKAVKEYRETGKISGEVKGPLGEAWSASEAFRTGKPPKYFKEKQPVPDSPQAVAAAQRAHEAGIGAAKRGREIKGEDWRKKREERLREEAAGKPPAKTEGVVPIPGKSPGAKGAKETPAAQAARREAVAKKAKEFKARGAAVPPVQPTAPAAGEPLYKQVDVTKRKGGGLAAKRKPVPAAAAPAAARAVPATVAELQGIASAGKMHTVDVKTIRDIANKEFAHDPKAAARVTQQFVEQRQVMGDAAKRKAATSAGLDVAAGQPPAPAGAPAPGAAPPAADQGKQIIDAAVASARESKSAYNIGQNMMVNVNDMPEGPAKNAARLRTQRFFEEAKTWSPEMAEHKVREYLTANPADASLTFTPPGGAQVSVTETGGPATVPYAKPVMEIAVRPGKAGKNAAKSAQQWADKVKKQFPNFDQTDPGWIEEAKARIPMPANAEKAFVQVGQKPPEATTRTVVAGPESGIPSVSAERTKEIKAQETLKAMGLGGTQQKTPIRGGVEQQGGESVTYRPETGGAPATPENIQLQQQRVMEVASGKVTPELQAMFDQAGVKEPGAIAGALRIAPWIVVPSLIEAMGFEGILPQVAGYAAIPSLQKKIEPMISGDPAVRQGVQEAYVKGMKSIPAPKAG